MWQPLSDWRDTRDFINLYRMGPVNKEAYAFFKLFIHFFVYEYASKINKSQYLLIFQKKLWRLKIFEDWRELSKNKSASFLQFVALLIQQVICSNKGHLQQNYIERLRTATICCEIADLQLKHLRPRPLAAKKNLLQKFNFNGWDVLFGFCLPRLTPRLHTKSTTPSLAEILTSMQ